MGPPALWQRLDRVGQSPALFHHRIEIHIKSGSVPMPGYPPGQLSLPGGFRWQLLYCARLPLSTFAVMYCALVV